MTDTACEEWRLLVQAEVDGELSTADSAALQRHVAGCPACAALERELVGLSARLRAEVAREPAPDRLRRVLQERLATVSAPATVPVLAYMGGSAPPAARKAPFVRRLWRPVTTFAAGAAIAASLMLITLPRPEPDGGGLADHIVAGHIRALQPGHLIDVISTDRHTVKPWFDGRIDFAPPVKDLAADGFPLLGGRLDYMDGRPVAALAYRHGQHIIDLFVWPQGAPDRDGAAAGERHGYNFVRWNADGMSFWAISDMNADDLALFHRQWRAAS